MRAARQQVAESPSQAVGSLDFGHTPSSCMSSSKICSNDSSRGCVSAFANMNLACAFDAEPPPPCRASAPWIW